MGISADLDKDSSQIVVPTPIRQSSSVHAEPTTSAKESLESKQQPAMVVVSKEFSRRWMLTVQAISQMQTKPSRMSQRKWRWTNRVKKRQTKRKTKLTLSPQRS